MFYVAYKYIIRNDWNYNHEIKTGKIKLLTVPVA